METTRLSQMTAYNHFHLLFKSGEKGLSQFMRKQLTWYAMYFNRKYHRSGHLFENRYKSILCEEDRYLLTLTRYIHLNAIRAGILKTIGELDQYPWSGHSVIMGNHSLDGMAPNYILSQFGRSLNKARIAYHKFMEEGLGLGYIPELSGGGLLRSHGGWSEVISMKRKGAALDFDDRVLGSSEFLKQLLQDTQDREKRQLKITGSCKGISDIIAEQGAESRISPRLLRSGSRRRDVSLARALIAKRCTEELGLTFAEIARSVGVTTSAVRRALLRYLANNQDQ
jgi:putative transposase